MLAPILEHQFGGKSTCYKSQSLGDVGRVSLSEIVHLEKHLNS